MKSKILSYTTKIAFLLTGLLQFSACAKKEFGTDYDAIVSSSKLRLQSSKTADEFEKSDYSIDKSYQLLKQKAAVQQKDICLYFKSMSTEDIYFFYPELEKDTQLECQQELIQYVKSKVADQMNRSLDTSVEIEPVPKPPGSPAPAPPASTRTAPSTAAPTLPGPSTSTPTSTVRPPSTTTSPRPTATPNSTVAPASARSANTIGLGTHSSTGEKLVKILSPIGKPHLFGGLGKKQIALTFDDGPHGHLSSLLMQSLKKQGVYATFFLVGKNTLAYKNLVKQEWASGHSVGGHSLTHANLAGLSYNSATYEIRGSMNNIVSVLGFTPNLFRFPYGARTTALSAYLAQQKIAEVAWNMDSLDWKYRNPQVLYNYAIQQVKNSQGGIILFHDIQPHTIAMMPTFLQWLRNNGYKTYLLKGNQILKPTQVVPKP